MSLGLLVSHTLAVYRARFLEEGLTIPIPGNHSSKASCEKTCFRGLELSESCLHLKRERKLTRFRRAGTTIPGVPEAGEDPKTPMSPSLTIK